MILISRFKEFSWTFRGLKQIFSRSFKHQKQNMQEVQNNKNKTFLVISRVYMYDLQTLFLIISLKLVFAFLLP